jgi:hypothetical protein
MSKPNVKEQPRRWTVNGWVWGSSGHAELSSVIGVSRGASREAKRASGRSRLALLPFVHSDRLASCARSASFHAKGRASALSTAWA